MAQAVVYVKGAERIMTSARLTSQGIVVHFADDHEGLIPFSELEFEEEPERVSLPDPHSILVHLKGGSSEEIPWDYARHFADAGYRERSKRASSKGLQQLGERLRRLRAQAHLSQEELAGRSGVGRVTIARIEAGEQSPRYETLVALAKGLKIPVRKLLLD